MARRECITVIAAQAGALARSADDLCEVKCLVLNGAMDLVLRRVASALALAVFSSCFSPAGNGSATEPASETGSSAGETASAATGSGGTDSSGTPTSEGPTTTATTDTGAPTSSGTDDPSSGTTMAPEGCADGVQRGDETDLDCGGSCPPCAADQGCMVDEDCLSMACLNDTCLAAAACQVASECPADQCMKALCVDFVCGQEAEAKGSPCDDEQVCTADEACDAGQCVATTPKPIALIDLPKDPGLGLYYDGIKTAELAGSTVRGAGDFNGDNMPDLLVVGSQPNQRVYVVYGGDTLATATLAGVANGEGGVLIDLDFNLPAAVSVAAAGDVDGDGFDDILIGTPQNSKSPLTGAAYVVFGRASSAALKFSADPPDVLLLTGPDMTANAFGVAVAGLGDVDGDLVDDFAVSSTLYEVNSAKVGAVFVVYGSNLLVSGKVEDFVTGSKGFRVAGPGDKTGFGTVLAGVGDFNKDGVGDVAVGQPNWGSQEGRAYVVFGQQPGKKEQLAAVPTPSQGLALRGNLNDKLGLALAGAGDFNADGFPDVIVGGGKDCRKVVVLYGGKTSGEVLVKNLLTDKQGVPITTLMPDIIGSAVGGGGDVNGDLIDDVVFGAPDSGMNGLAYVVFGAKGDPVERKVADLVLGKGGFALAGPGPDTQTGASVTLVPSVNADELAEVFIGAPGHGVNNEGRAYLVYGGKCEG